MTDKRKELVDAYHGGIAQLNCAIFGLSPELLTFRPFPEAWTCIEHIVHLVEMEMSGYLRCRSIVAECGKTVWILDEELWTQHLDYHSESIDDYLTEFVWLRERNTAFLRRQPDAVWDENFVIRPQFGRIDLEIWVKIYIKHLTEHIGYIERNCGLWRSNGTGKC